MFLKAKPLHSHFRSANLVDKLTNKVSLFNMKQPTVFLQSEFEMSLEQNICSSSFVDFIDGCSRHIRFANSETLRFNAVEKMITFFSNSFSHQKFENITVLFVLMGVFFPLQKALEVT